MKKNWSNPEMQTLDISATAGGKNWQDHPDGEYAQDENNVWYAYHGINELSPGQG